MATNENEGPLAALSRLLGIDAELPVIAQLKRIAVMPRRLNIPEHYTTTEIDNLVERGELPERVTPIPVNLPEVAELFFSTTKRHDYTFEQVPVGHDLGWRCYGPNYDGDAADGNTDFGDGKTKDEAYAAYLRDTSDEPSPRLGRLVDGGSGVQPPEHKPEIYRDPNEDDAVTFDDDLEDRT
jgi:hypothetical protein